jgi:hypothetical protein
MFRRQGFAFLSLALDVAEKLAIMISVTVPSKCAAACVSVVQSGRLENE